jgi:uncharacterized small protein (TIGR04563 family)
MAYDGRMTDDIRSPEDKRKQSLYFPEDMLREIVLEARRLDRSVSWMVQRAWKLARQDIKELDERSVRCDYQCASMSDARPPQRTPSYGQGLSTRRSQTPMHHWRRKRLDVAGEPDLPHPRQYV